MIRRGHMFEEAKHVVKRVQQVSPHEVVVSSDIHRKQGDVASVHGCLCEG